MLEGRESRDAIVPGDGGRAKTASSYKVPIRFF